MAWYRCGMNGTYNATTVSRSGAICNYVANVGGVPLSRFIANITPVQAGSGDPSPSNQRLITGWSAVNVGNSGKNLFNKNAAGLISNKYVEQDGTETTNSYFSISDYIRIGGSEITVSGSTNSGNKPSICFYDGAKNFISGIKHSSFSFPHTYTVPTGAVYLRESISTPDIDTFQLELGSTATTYQSYTGQTVTINLNGTFYVGTVNLNTGVFTATGLLTTYNKNSSWRRNTSGVFYTDAPNGISDLYISNMFECFLPKGASNPLADGQCRLNTGSRFINFKVTSCDTVEDFEAFLGDNTIQIIYTLATPVEYQLTSAQLAQVVGENNVWADSGDSEVDFFKIIRT